MDNGFEMLAGLIEIVRDEKKFGKRLEELRNSEAVAKDYHDKGVAARKDADQKLSDAKAAQQEMAAKHNDIHQRMEPLIKTTQEMSETLTANTAALVERERAFEKMSTEKRQELDRRERAIDVRERRVTDKEGIVAAREATVSAKEADLASRFEKLKLAVA